MYVICINDGINPFGWSLVGPFESSNEAELYMETVLKGAQWKMKIVWMSKPVQQGKAL